MKTKNIAKAVRAKINSSRDLLIYSSILVLSFSDKVLAQTTAPGATSALGTKAQNLSNMIINVLEILLFAVAAGAFIWMVIGILTKAQDIKQRVLYFVIGVVLMGLKSTIINALMTL